MKDTLSIIQKFLEKNGLSINNFESVDFTKLSCTLTIFNPEKDVKDKVFNTFKFKKKPYRKWYFFEKNDIVEKKYFNFRIIIHF